MPDQDPLQMISQVIDDSAGLLQSATIPAAPGLDGTDSVMGGFVQNMTSAARKVRDAATAYQRDLEQLEAQAHAMPPDGAELERLRLRDRLETAITEADQQLEANQLVAEAHATTKAIPAPPKDTGEQQLLRDEARMILDGVGPADIESYVANLARGDRRDIAAMIASRWGRAYLESRGIDDADQVHRRMVEGVALEAAGAPHATDMERAASNALRLLRKEAPGLRAAAVRFGRMTVDSPGSATAARERARFEAADLARKYR